MPDEIDWTEDDERAANWAWAVRTRKVEWLPELTPDQRRRIFVRWAETGPLPLIPEKYGDEVVSALLSREQERWGDPLATLPPSESKDPAARAFAEAIIRQKFREAWIETGHAPPRDPRDRPRCAGVRGYTRDGKWHDPERNAHT